MSDDWRVTATFHEDGAARVLERLHEHVVENDARKLLGSHVAVSVDGDNVFLYADTRDSARQAERIVREILEREGLSAYVKLDHWHKLAEEWEDQSVPLPQTDAEREAEHEHREEEETEDSQESGLASWEVRVECASRGDAVEFVRVRRGMVSAAGRLRDRLERGLVKRGEQVVAVGVHRGARGGAYADRVDVHPGLLGDRGGGGGVGNAGRAAAGPGARAGSGRAVAR